LLYFWSVAKHGTVAKACEELHLAQPTISGQIMLLEEALGEQLFIRTGRRLVMTEMGQVVFKYAEDIFATGQELMNTVKGRGTNGHPSRLVVGIVDVVAKPLATQFLKSALKVDPSTLLICREDKLPFLLTDLAVHELDLVIADSPAPPDSKAGIYNHLLGESGVTLFATAKLAARYRRGFPQSLQGAPMLLPTTESKLRQLLDPWMTHRELTPQVVGEFDDSMTLKAFGQDGYGIFPGASAIEKEICRQFKVQAVGHLDSLKQYFYGITVERRLKHPAVLAIVQAARRDLHP
jgi:LysR family transcriptional activator of nhaA